MNTKTTFFVFMAIVLVLGFSVSARDKKSEQKKVVTPVARQNLLTPLNKQKPVIKSPVKIIDIKEATRSTQLDIAKRNKEKMDRKLAEMTGCLKTDQKKAIYVSAIQKNPEKDVEDTQLNSKGTAYYDDPNKPGGGIDEIQDTCEGEYVKEYFCIDVADKGWKEVSYFLYLCPTGSACVDGKCKEFGSNGCIPGQSPFLDVTGNGAPDSCDCPDMAPMDTNKDGNSDACITKGMTCSKIFDPVAEAETFPNSTVNDLYDPATGEAQKVINYCANVSDPQACGKKTVIHIVCSKSDVLSTSSTPCPAGHECQNGTCLPTGGGTCDASKMDLSPEKLGYVTLTDAQGAQTVYADQCDSLDVGIVKNAACGTGCDESFTFVNSPCPVGSICNDGACSTALVVIPDDGIDCTKMPNIPECTGVDCAKTPNDPKCVTGPTPGGGGGEGDPPCEPKTTNVCKDDNDPTQEVHIFGSLKYGKKVEGCSLDGEELKDKYDVCVLEMGSPKLYQYGCNGGSITDSYLTCDISKMEDCDPKAETKEGKGVCKKFNPPVCVDTSIDPNDLSKAGEVSGIDGFGHPFSEKDHCEPAQGFDVVAKWSCTTEGSQGHKYDLTSCPSGQECAEGICKPLPPPDNETCADTPNVPTCKDSDQDGVVDAFDNCPSDKNSDQLDTDKDGMGDVCDSKPTTATDTDKDTIPDALDNCPTVPNLDQKDTDGDGVGDLCETKDIDCEKEPNNPICQLPEPEHVCEDNDTSNNIFFRGDVYIDKGKPGEKQQSDYCVDDYTAVMEISCGPQGKVFLYKKWGCPGGSKCSEGKCEQ